MPAARRTARPVIVRSSPATSPLSFDSHGDTPDGLGLGSDWWKPSVEKWINDGSVKPFDWTTVENLAVTFVGDSPTGGSLYVVSFAARAPWGQSLPHVYFVSRI